MENEQTPENNDNSYSKEKVSYKKQINNMR